MTRVLVDLLDLDTLRFGAEGVAFGFERPFPAWAWVTILVAAAVIAGASYRRLDGPTWARGCLAGLRAALLALVALLISGPRLVERSESLERDWALVLVDRSASMTIADAPPAAPGGPRRSREAQLRDAVASSWPMWEELSREREVVWLGFDAGAFDLAMEPADDAGERRKPALGEPEGKRTSLASAMSQALRRSAARPLSAVVVISDGRSLDEPSRSALRQLQAERIPVHTVALGSERPVGDLAILRVEAPEVAFVNDVAPVTVELVRTGAADVEAATVRLIDKESGRTLAEREALVGPEATEVTLSHTPDAPGESAWIVEIEPRGQDDLIEANNRVESRIRLVDRPMRVLYIDGYPRWEQRYLKNLLIREKSIVSSNLLLAPNRRYLQEGDVELDALPDSPERWAEFDAIIIGDVEPGVFTSAQLEQIREHVASRGAGLIWIGGAGATPNRWFGTALADLLPMSAPGGAGGFGGGGTIGPIGESVVARPTPIAERLGILRLGANPEDPWPADLSDATAGWSLIRWAQRIPADSVKPAAETLALASVVGNPAETHPLALSMRFGAGRALYVATDEIWRWRYARGEALPERFWVQMLRFIGRESLARSGRSAALAVSPRAAVVEQPVRVSVELLDQSLIDAGLASVAVRLERRAEPGEELPASPVEVVLRPEDARFTSVGPRARRFAATWLPSEAGVWTARAVEPALAGLAMQAEVQVALPNDEMRRPEADFALLARLSAETGGASFTEATLSTLPEHIPNRQLRILRERSETLWDTPLALILVVTLLTLEWVGRRLVRLI